MLYIRLSCEVLTDAKLLQVGPEAAFVWVRGLLYAKQHLTDGFIPRHALPLLCLGTAADADGIADKLTNAGLWTVVDGGWHVGADKWARHQVTRDQVEEKRETWRRQKALQRAGLTDVRDVSTQCPRNVRPPEPEPEPEPEPQKKKKRKASPPEEGGDGKRNARPVAAQPSEPPSACSDAEFVATLADNPAYTHINLPHELAKMDTWLAVHRNRQKTRRFVVNWLNKIERPLGPTPGRPPPRTAGEVNHETIMRFLEETHDDQDRSGTPRRHTR